MPFGLNSIMKVFASKSIPENAAVVTPNDSNDLANPGVIYVGVAGDIKVDMLGTGTAIPYKSVSGWLPAKVKRVYATGTTATDIIVGY